MKRILVAVLLALTLSSAAKAENTTLFSAIATSGTYGCAKADGTVGPCDLSGFRSASFQVTSVAGSVATVDFQVRNTPNDPWATVFTVVNPGTAELGYTGSPVSGQCQVVVTWTSGTLTGTLVRTK